MLADSSLSEASLRPFLIIIGEGLADLVATPEQVLLETASRPDLERPWLWIDRAFGVAGYGTVVTGTRLDGVLALGQELEILPARAKSRSAALETLKRAVAVVQPGARVAVRPTRLPACSLSHRLTPYQYSQ